MRLGGRGPRICTSGRSARWARGKYEANKLSYYQAVDDQATWPIYLMADSALTFHKGARSTKFVLDGVEKSLWDHHVQWCVSCGDCTSEEAKAHKTIFTLNALIWKRFSGTQYMNKCFELLKFVAPVRKSCQLGRTPCTLR